MPRLAIALVLLAVLSDLAGAQQHSAQRGRPRDLNAYSLRFWARDTLRLGQTVSTSTPYGILTCTSRGRGPRQCSLR